MSIRWSEVCYWISELVEFYLMLGPLPFHTAATYLWGRWLDGAWELNSVIAPIEMIKTKKKHNNTEEIRSYLVWQWCFARPCGWGSSCESCLALFASLFSYRCSDLHCNLPPGENPLPYTNYYPLIHFCYYHGLPHSSQNRSPREHLRNQIPPLVYKIFRRFHLEF